MSFFSKFKGGYQELWKAIIRPPKDEYTLDDLGPKEFRIGGKLIRRTDMDIKNKRGFTLKCSYFEPVKRVAELLPCVIYLHGNCSSRMEALPCIDELMPANIQLFCFDFSGCGLSEGEYISLGWFERDDVEVIVDFLRKSNKVSTIGLWGRSMGAATAIMHADRDPSIGGMVLDSAFTSLKKVAEDLCKTYATKMPNFLISGALSLIRSTVQKKANFDINNLSPIDHVKEGFIPALFAAGKEDTFINPEHTKQLYQEYAGDKNIIMVDGDHNTSRPQFFLDSVGIFFYNTLQCDQLPIEPVKEIVNYPTKIGSALQLQGYQNSYQHKIGNQEDVANALDDFDEDELNRAIQESLKINQDAGNVSKPSQQELNQKNNENNNQNNVNNIFNQQQNQLNKNQQLQQQNNNIEGGYGGQNKKSNENLSNHEEQKINDVQFFFANNNVNNQNDLNNNVMYQQQLQQKQKEEIKEEDEKNKKSPDLLDFDDDYDAVFQINQDKNKNKKYPDLLDFEEVEFKQKQK